MRPADPLNRREFLRRAAGAGLGITLAGGLSGLAFDPEGPAGLPREEAKTGLPDFSLPGTAGRLAIARGAERRETLGLALRALGGIESFVRPGDRVLIKVNAAFASPPILSATTHPDLVFELVRLCFAAGAAAVVVTDNPINDPASCFALSGIGPAARRAGAALVLPSEGLFTPVSLAGGSLIRNWPVLTGPLAGVTRLIGVAPVKDHHRSGASLTLKNWYGLLGGRRNLFHQDVHRLIAELAVLVRPTLVVLDGTTAMMTNGPTGGSLSDLRETRTLIAGTDPVAVDACGAELLGKRPGDLPFLGAAERAGAGTVDFRRLAPAEVST